LAGEGDGVAVGRPGGGGQRVDAGDADVLDPARVGVDDGEVVVPFFEDDEGELARVGRPAAGAVDEAQRVEVRIAIGGDELADDATRLRIREEEIDVEDLARGEEGDVAAV